MPKSQNEQILLTGICGRLGRLIARNLHREYELIGLDRRPFPEKPKDIIHYKIDLRRKKCETIFREHNIRIVVHMGIMHDPRMSATEHHSFNVFGTQTLLGYCAKYDVPKIIILSSASVYGPRPDNTQHISEESPLMGGEKFPDIRDLIAVDMYASSFMWKNPSTETVILRPVHIVGNVHNGPSKYLRLNRIPTLLGYDPMVQLIHQDDVANAIMCALKPGIKGVFNITGPSAVPLSTLIRELGKQKIPLPEPVFKTGLEWLWKFGLTSFPTPELDHIKYICMVDGSLAEKELGYNPQRSLMDIIAFLKANPVFS
jgi:UDP-glucose 4-epimerase